MIQLIIQLNGIIFLEMYQEVYVCVCGGGGRLLIDIGLEEHFFSWCPNRTGFKDFFSLGLDHNQTA